MMSRFISFLISLSALAYGLLAYSGQFQNLDFEQARTNTAVRNGVGDVYGPIQDLLPGWRLEKFGGGVTGVQTNTGLNTQAPGIGFDTLLTTDYYRNTFSGQFAFAMSAGGIFNIGYSLSQVGDVPSDAKSLRFFNFIGRFELWINGSLMPVFYTDAPSQAKAGARFGAADVSAYAGKEILLEFRPLPADAIANFSGLDNISFSPIPVPEPSSVVLFFCGVSVLLGVNRAAGRG